MQHKLIESLLHFGAFLGAFPGALRRSEFMGLHLCQFPLVPIDRVAFFAAFLQPAYSERGAERLGKG